MKKAGIIAIYLIIVLALAGCNGTDTFVEDTVSPTAAPTEATTAQSSPSEQLTATQTPSPEPTQEPISFNEPSEIFNEVYNPFYWWSCPKITAPIR
jgi:predicted small secreted protein